jgi:hypothetical protein
MGARNRAKSSQENKDAKVIILFYFSVSIIRNWKSISKEQNKKE